MELDTEFRYPNVIDFFGTTLFHVCQFTKLDLYNYSTYNKYAENNISQSNANIAEEVRCRLDKHDESHHEDIVDDYAHVFHELGDIYPAMHRKAMVITLYNFFEHQIKTLCGALNRLLPNDMSDKYKLNNACIKRYRKFLRCEAGFDINLEGGLWRQWEDMLKVEQIRHVLGKVRTSP